MVTISLSCLEREPTSASKPWAEELSTHSSLSKCLDGLNTKSGSVNLRMIYTALRNCSPRKHPGWRLRSEFVLKIRPAVKKGQFGGVTKLQRVPSMRANQRENCPYQGATSRGVMNSFYFLFFSDPADIIIEYTCTCLSFHPWLMQNTTLGKERD